MNRQQAAALVPLYQAMADGKELQYLDKTDKWIDKTGNILNWEHPERYRIKPEKKKGWLVIKQSRYPYSVPHSYPFGKIHNTKEDALMHANKNENDNIACIEIEYEEGQGL